MNANNMPCRWGVLNQYAFLIRPRQAGHATSELIDMVFTLAEGILGVMDLETVRGAYVKTGSKASHWVKVTKVHAPTLGIDQAMSGTEPKHLTDEYIATLGFDLFA